MKRLYTSQSGMVSIFVTTMLIIIVSLIVLAFAQISRREQRESLDTQLSTQAYYAAESGVNDAKTAVANYIASKPAGTPLPEKKTCADDPNYTLTNTLKQDVGYSCVIINPTPTYLSANVGSSSQVIPIKTSDGASLSSLTLSWTGSSNGGAADMTKCPAAGVLPAGSPWTDCPFGGIRLDLVPVNGPVNRDALLTSDMVAFLMPNNTSGSGTVDYTQRGTVVSAKDCSTGTCTVTITGLSSPNYYMRVSQLYRSSNLVITGTSSTGAVKFKDSQILVDSTGKAQDVLRRILVAVPVERINDKVPSSAIESGDSVCKKFNVADGLFDNKASIAGDSNPLCGGSGN